MIASDRQFHQARASLQSLRDALATEQLESSTNQDVAPELRDAALARVRQFPRAYEKVKCEVMHPSCQQQPGTGEQDPKTCKGREAARRAPEQGNGNRRVENSEESGNELSRDHLGYPRSPGQDCEHDPRHQREGASDGKDLLWRHIALQKVPGVVAAEARLTDFQLQIAVTRAHAPNSPNVSASGLRMGWPRSACMSSSTTNVK